MNILEAAAKGYVLDEYQIRLPAAKKRLRRIPTSTQFLGVVSLGPRVKINQDVLVGERATLGKRAHIHRGAFIGTSTELGDYAYVGANSSLLGHNFLGTGAVVLAGAVLNEHVLLPPGAVIGRDRVILNNGMVWTFTSPDSDALATMYGTPEGVMVYHDDLEMELDAYLTAVNMHAYGYGRRQILIDMAADVQRNFDEHADELPGVLERTAALRSQFLQP